MYLKCYWLFVYIKKSDSNVIIIIIIVVVVYEYYIYFFLVGAFCILCIFLFFVSLMILLSFPPPTKITSLPSSILPLLLHSPPHITTVFAEEARAVSPFATTQECRQ